MAEDVVSQFCMTLWSIWARRNSKLWDNSEESAQQCMYRGASVSTTWMMANEKPLARTAVPHAASWTKSPSGYLKCNIDASFHSASGSTGFGMCIRDHMGQFILAKTCHSWPLMDVKEGEATAMLRALQ